MQVDRRNGRRTAVAWALVLAAALVAGLAAPAAAHVKNEASQFPDIEAHPAAADIVMLVGLGVVPETPVFEPERALSRDELAVWAALSHDLGPGGENPDVAQLARRGLDEGLVPSLEGEATYADIDEAVFDGAVTVSQERQHTVPTRAEAAVFVTGHLTADLGGGTTLLTRLGARMGPTGEVSRVEVAGGTTTFTVGEVQLPVDGHARVAFGPTDLVQWEGRYVTRALAAEGDGQERLTFIEAGEPPAEEENEKAGDEPEVPDSGSDSAAAADEPPAEPVAQEPGSTGPGWLLYGLLALLGVVTVVIFGRR